MRRKVVRIKVERIQNRRSELVETRITSDSDESPAFRVQGNLEQVRTGLKIRFWNS